MDSGNATRIYKGFLATLNKESAGKVHPTDAIAAAGMLLATVWHGCAVDPAAPEPLEEYLAWLRKMMTEGPGAFLPPPGSN